MLEERSRDKEEAQIRENEVSIVPKHGLSSIRGIEILVLSRLETSFYG